MKIVCVAVAFLVAASGIALAGSDGARLPRFAALKSDRVFVREGPSKEHRIKWVYQRKGLPVEVLATFDVWWRVRDMDGEVGWIHRAMLSGERNALVVGKGNADLRAENAVADSDIAEVQPGAIGHLQQCNLNACELKFGNLEGWIWRSRLWGVYGDERAF